MEVDRAKVAAEYRRLARVYRDMAECWWKVLFSPVDAERCIADAERHERLAELLEQSAARP